MITHKLKVFCTPFCPKCNQLLAYLNKKKADYISYDIDKDDIARKEAVKIVGTDDIESLDKRQSWSLVIRYCMGLTRKKLINTSTKFTIDFYS